MYLLNQKLNQYLSKAHLEDLMKYSRKINNRVFVWSSLPDILEYSPLNQARCSRELGTQASPHCFSPSKNCFCFSCTVIWCHLFILRFYTDDSTLVAPDIREGFSVRDPGAHSRFIMLVLGKVDPANGPPWKLTAGKPRATFVGCLQQRNGPLIGWVWKLISWLDFFFFPFSWYMLFGCDLCTLVSCQSFLDVRVVMESCCVKETVASLCWLLCCLSVMKQNRAQ